MMSILDILVAGIGGLGAIFSILLVLLIPVYIIGMAVLQYFLTIKFDDKKIIIFIIFAILNFPGCVVCAMVYSLMYMHKQKKSRDEIFAKLTTAPNDSIVDEYIAHLNKFGCEDTPNAWHQVRGVWYACNNSSNITTDKKKELLTLLLLKGLYLNNEEKKIVDNYAK